MKLAIISPNILPVPALDGGAVEELTTYIIEENEESHRYDIDLYTIDNDDRLKNIDYKFTNIIRVKYVPNHRKEKLFNKLNKILARMPNGRMISDFSEKITSKYKKNYYDAVVVEDNRQVFNSLIRKVKNERVYFHVHDDVYPSDSELTRLQKIIHPSEDNMIKGIIKSSNKIIAVSNYLENRFKQFGAKNTVTLYNGVIKKELTQLSIHNQKLLKQKYGIKKDDIVFTFIGRFTDDKGIDKLLEALRLLQDTSKVKCLIVGKNWLHSESEDNYTKKLTQIYQKLPEKTKENIVFTGYIDHKDINEIYSITDCLVIPSQYEEVFGVVALEAMTMGVPVIASNSGGLPEVLGNSALIINRNADFTLNLATAMTKICNNSNLRSELGRNGIERSYKFPNTKKQYFDNFCKIVK